MKSINLSDESTQISRITRIGMVWNLTLSALKLIVGYLTGSLGLIADGFHSLSDLVTDFAVIIGSAIGSKPADKNHPYGHGKFETFSVLFVSLILILVGIGLIWKAVSSVGKENVELNGLAVVSVAIVSIAVKEWLYRITLSNAEKCRSTALKANAWHHRSDALSSVVILAGGVAAIVGWNEGDTLAGLLVGVMIIAVGGKLAFEALVELSEGSADAETIANIENIVANLEDVRRPHKLRVRRIGRELVMDIHIMLDANLTVGESHEIVTHLEQTVQENLDWPISLVVHVDPDESTSIS
ncbi:cation diffusion facilitator family transporter [bacterium]|nr:cation diffusion facilitator family transporter [bacterium]